MQIQMKIQLRQTLSKRTMSLHKRTETDQLAFLNVKNGEYGLHKRNLCDKKITSLKTDLSPFLLLFNSHRFLSNKLHCSYLECSLSRLPTDCVPSDIPATNITLTANALRLRRENAKNRATSQIVGLALLGVGVSFFVLGKRATFWNLCI